MSQTESQELPLIVEKSNKGETQYYVNMTSKKGKEIKTRIQTNVIAFDTTKDQNGVTVSVEVENGLIKKVTIPGQPEVMRQVPPPRQNPGNRRGGQGGKNQGGGGRTALSPVSTNSLKQGSPEILGGAFHNPYTFIPFASNQDMPEKRPFTPRTKDELEKNRFSGIIELEIKTLSPLMTNGAIPKAENNGHKIYSALTIGNDVIVPATGIRGFLRNLLTIITGGPLTTIDEGTFLCQGRDLQLGSGKVNVPGNKNVYLGRVVEAGNHKKTGKIERGETRLIDLKDFIDKYGDLPPYIKANGSIDKTIWIELDDNEFDPQRPQLRKIRSTSKNRDKKHSWQLKSSGRSVKGKKKRDGSEADKFEGVFKATGELTELSCHIWAEYAYRNKHGDKKALYKNDLVWLEIDESSDEIKSIQWARWGRRGMKLQDAVPSKVYPDYLQKGNKISCVTNLFGQVPVSAGKKSEDKKQDKPFAGRIRPENLVFIDAKSKIKGPFPLAVLSSPHPGCIAFYRDSDDPTQISSNHKLRGYKVYRTSEESGMDNSSAPWKFETQGIFQNDGKIDPREKQKANFSAQLLGEKCEGTLRLSVRALSNEELALLLLACNTKWRLGGGKPLGLGRCRAEVTKIINEFGEDVSEEIKASLDQYDSPFLQLARDRLKIWEKSQIPVDNLRYPRAVVRNNSPKNSRSGLSWFGKFTTPKTSPDNENVQIGLIPIMVTGELKEKVQKTGVNNSNLGEKGELIAAQPLPSFNPVDPSADVLYGYDLLFNDTKDDEGIPELDSKRRKKIEFNTAKNVDAYPELVLFDETKHISGREQSRQNNSQNAGTRQHGRDQR